MPNLVGTVPLLKQTKPTRVGTRMLKIDKPKNNRVPTYFFWGRVPLVKDRQNRKKNAHQLIQTSHIWTESMAQALRVSAEAGRRPLGAAQKLPRLRGARGAGACGAAQGAGTAGTARIEGRRWIGSLGQGVR